MIPNMPIIPFTTTTTKAHILNISFTSSFRIEASMRDGWLQTSETDVQEKLLNASKKRDKKIKNANIPSSQHLHCGTFFRIFIKFK